MQNAAELLVMTTTERSAATTVELSSGITPEVPMPNAVVAPVMMRSVLCAVTTR